MRSYTRTNKELASSTHWRRLRSILTSLSSAEGIELKEYDTFNIQCYKTVGTEMQGANVQSNCYFAFVNDNLYDIYEIPRKSNQSHFKFNGDFLILAKNVDYDYWVFGELNYKKQNR